MLRNSKFHLAQQSCSKIKTNFKFGCNARQTCKRPEIEWVIYNVARTGSEQELVSALFPQTVQFAIAVTGTVRVGRDGFMFRVERVAGMPPRFIVKKSGGDRIYVSANYYCDLVLFADRWRTVQRSR